MNYTGKESGKGKDFYRITLHRVDIRKGDQEKVKFTNFLTTHRGANDSNMTSVINTHTYALWFLHQSVVEIIIEEIEALFPIREEYLELINYKKYSDFHEKLESNFISLFSFKETTTNTQNIELDCVSDNFFITMNSIRSKA